MPSCSMCGKETDNPKEDNWCSFGEFTVPDRDKEGEFVEKDYGVAIIENEEKDDFEFVFEVSKEEADEYDDFWGVSEWTGEEKTVEYWECEDCCSD